MRTRFAAVLATLAIAVAAGCGGKEGGPPGERASGAQVVPASTAFLLRLNTDFESEQLAALENLSERFPVLKQALESLGDGDVTLDELKAALGPELDLLALDRTDFDEEAFLGLTQPKDEAAFRALLERQDEPPVVEEIDGWQVFADERETIDRFKNERRGGALAGDERFQEATGGLPEDALATLFIDGEALQEAVKEQREDGFREAVLSGLERLRWVSAAVAVEEHGLGVELRVGAEGIEARPYASELVSEVPADALLFLSFKGLDEPLEDLLANEELQKLLGPARQLLGETLEEVVALFEGELALYARPGTPLPEVTLVLKTPDVERDLATLDRLAGLVALATKKTPEETEVAGVTAKRLDFDQLSLYYAGFDGKLVLTTAESGIEGLAEPGLTLAEATRFQTAAEAAGLPGETAGFVYVDVAEALPLIENVAELAKKPIPAGVRENLEPLQTLLLYGSVDGDTAALKGFLAVE